jgi:hypothetical protein
VAMTGCPPDELYTIVVLLCVVVTLFDFNYREIEKMPNISSELTKLHSAGNLLGVSCNRGYYC